MSTTIDILREGRVILCTISDSFTFTEIGEMITFIQQEILGPATKRIHTIYDFSAVKHLPPNVLSATRKLMPKPHPMAGFSILVTPNPFIKRLIDTLSKLIPPDTMLVCGTVEEALEEMDRRLTREVT